jgi:hypothetical protein
LIDRQQITRLDNPTSVSIRSISWYQWLVEVIWFSSSTDWLCRRSSTGFGFLQLGWLFWCVGNHVEIQIELIFPESLTTQTRHRGLILRGGRRKKEVEEHDRKKNCTFLGSWASGRAKKKIYLSSLGQMLTTVSHTCN